jgi:hypothetical protein
LYTFAPSIVASYGYGRLKANAMVTIGFWLLLVTNIAWGVIADRWGRRGPMVFLGVAIGWALVVRPSSLQPKAQALESVCILAEIPLVGCESIDRENGQLRCQICSPHTHSGVQCQLAPCPWLMDRPKH